MGETFEAGRDDECLSLHKGYIKRCMVNINSYKKIIKSSKAAPKKIYIFSKEGFTKQINRKYKEDEVFVLINNSEL